nr:ATP-binding protein [Granulicella rosea]
MRRRSRRGPNESESTGKSGQGLPTGQLAPLRPTYPEPIVRPEDPVELEASAEPATSAHEEVQDIQDAPQADRQTDYAVAVDDAGESAGGPPEESQPDLTAPEGFAPAEAEKKVVVETQPDSLATPPAEQTAVKSPRGYVVLTIGLPGSGKTTWYKRRGVTPLSSDMLRSILFDDITEQRYQGLVFSTLRSLLRARLIAKMPWNYVDATNLSPHERKQWIKMAKSFGYEVQAVFFDVPLAVCMDRNSKRDRQVTDEVMQKMAERLRPPAFKEGFDKITVVRVKGAAPSEPIAEPVVAPESPEPKPVAAAPEAVPAFVVPPTDEAEPLGKQWGADADYDAAT